MNQQPLVSVIIPSYNRAYIIEKSIRSVLEQSYRNIEVIIIDDGSTDDTRHTVRSIRDDRLQYYYQNNARQSAARNNGVRKAHGEWIAFHDSDDTWRQGKLEKQMNLALSGQYDVVFCKLAQHNPDGNVVIYPKRIPEGLVTVRQDLYGIGTQSLLIRSSVCKAESFDLEMKRYEDFEWMYRVTKKYRVYCLDEALVDYTINADSVSTNYEKMYDGLDWLLRKYPEIPREAPAIALHSARELMEGWVKIRKSGHAGDSKKYFQLARRYFPGILTYLRTRE